ncbi:MAG: NnrS family protein [Rhodospirillaceae bacterium]|nr:NnrS family protein [Rhodospirillaceae bacterium]
MNNRIPIDDHDQPEVTSTSAVLSAGFRPFFIFAGLSGVVPVLAWVLAYTGNGSTPGDFSPAYWHGHEMIFGFVIAAASGFLLTAVPNWTRSGPFSGWQLGLLVLIWLAGRLAMWFGEPAGSPFVAVIDLTMIPVLALYIGKRLLAYKMRRNYIVLAVLFVLFSANVLMHLEATQVLADSAGFGLNLGIFVVVLLVTLISGRVIPGFTANALRRRETDVDTQTPDSVTRVVIISVILAAAFDLLDLQGAGVVAVVAALALLVRMARWKTLLILDDPLVWVLHAGHLWLVMGFVLLSVARFSDGLERDAGLHALTAGAMGTMVLGMMTRVSLGHSGRELKVSTAIVAAYLMVIAGALVRVIVAIFPEQLPGDSFSYLISVAGLLWAGGYAIFLGVYWPILTRPRL